MMRSRPFCSVTSIVRPSGRKAILHGCTKPVAMGTTRIRWLPPTSKMRDVAGSAQEPLFLVSPYRDHIRSAHARLRAAKEASRLFLLGAASPPNLGGEFHSVASRHFPTNSSNKIPAVVALRISPSFTHRVYDQ